MVIRVLVLLFGNRNELMKHYRASFIAVALAAGVPGTAVAQTDGSGGALGALKQCRLIGEDTARLACFDRESRALVDAAMRNDVVVMDKTEIKATRRSLFGFALPRIALFGGGKNEAEDVGEIDVAVSSARMLAGEKWAFTTEDGAQWQTTEPSYAVPHAGDKVTLRRAALGSYFAKFRGGRAVRAMRVR